MKSIFSENDYKLHVESVIKGLPKRGRGQFAKLAAHLKLHPTRVSQIFRGALHLTPDQAQSVCEFFAWSGLEAEFFVTLVLRERAETAALRKMFDAQLERIRKQSKGLVHRVPRDRILTDEQKSEFYSSWFYSAIRLATSIDGLNSAPDIADFFQMDRRRVQQVIEFLLANGLCIEEKGKIVMGPKTTHLEQGSPLVLRHHSNWRVRALARHESMREEEMAYTCPVSLRAEDMPAIREMLTQVIQKFLKQVTASDPPDTLACLNIDWFRVHD